MGKNLLRKAERYLLPANGPPEILLSMEPKRAGAISDDRAAIYNRMSPDRVAVAIASVRLKTFSLVKIART